MKELTIEQKAERYDDAIRRAKEINREHSKRGFKPSDDVIYIFPELTESDDEKIRKAIIEFFELQDDNTTYSLVPKKDILAWLEEQGKKDELIQELGEYKAKYIQETLGKALTMNNKDDERLRKTTISFLKEFADKGYENAIECIDWLKKQGETSESLNEFLDEEKPAEDSCKNSDDITREEIDRTEYKKGFECGKQRVLKYPEDFGLYRKPSDKVEPKFK